MLSHRSDYHYKVALKKLNKIKLEILATFQNDLTLISVLDIQEPFDFGQWLRDICIIVMNVARLLLASVDPTIRSVFGTQFNGHAGAILYLEHQIRIFWVWLKLLEWQQHSCRQLAEIMLLKSPAVVISSVSLSHHMMSGLINIRWILNGRSSDF